MSPLVAALLQSLSLGKKTTLANDETGESSTVTRLAHVYEIARNALEYRADHLVRRASIERILRRQLLFDLSPARIAIELLQELRWARYITDETFTSGQLETILQKYLPLMSSSLDRNWLIGILSAEIEESLNPNSDYKQFTTFAFHVLERYLSTPADLELYMAIDKGYSQSDDARVAYHLFQLLSTQVNENALLATWQHFQSAIKSPVLNRLGIFVRQHSGPLVLLRDIYFAYPNDFAVIVEDPEKFKAAAQKVLQEQLKTTGKRISTAAFRSISHVF